MPEFKTHTIANTLIALPLFGYLFLNNSDVLLPVTLGYGLSTLVISPDLDLYTSKISRNWGLLRPLVWGYSKVFHHGQFSHKPILGTFTRYLYFILVALVMTGLLAIWYENALLVWRYVTELWSFFIFMFLGSCLADLIHEFLDFIITDGELRIKHRH